MLGREESMRLVGKHKNLCENPNEQMNLSFAFAVTIALTLTLIAVISAIVSARSTKPIALKKAAEPPKPKPQPVENKATDLSEIKKANATVDALKDGERATIVIKNDRCPWCKKFMGTLDELKKTENKILGEIVIVNAISEIKTAFNPAIAAGLAEFRGLPHTVIVDKTSAGFSVASFGGFVPAEKLSEALSAASAKATTVN